MPHSPTQNCCTTTTDVLPVSFQSQTSLKPVSNQAKRVGRAAGAPDAALGDSCPSCRVAKPATLGNEPRVGPMEDLLGEVFAGRARPWRRPNCSSSSDKCGELGSYSGFLRI